MFVGGGRFRKGARAGVSGCAIAGLLLLAGCGGGGSSSSATAEGKTASDHPPITKAQLIKRGDTICREIDVIQNTKFEKFVAEHQNAPTNLATQETQVRVAGLPPITVEIRRIAALGAPEGNENEVEAIVRGLERALTKVEGDPALVIEKEHSPFDAPDKLAEKYGFRDCDEAL